MKARVMSPQQSVLLQSVWSIPFVSPVQCLVLYESAFVDSVTGTLDVNDELKADQEYQENVSSFWLKVTFSMLDAETKNFHVHLKNHINVMKK